MTTAIKKGSPRAVADLTEGLILATVEIAAPADGTRLTLRHTGFAGRPDSCEGHASGWERVLGWLRSYFPTEQP